MMSSTFLLYTKDESKLSVNIHLIRYVGRTRKVRDQIRLVSLHYAEPCPILSTLG